jgi:hypothetical protein
MNTPLDIFNPQVSKIDSTITVTYCHLNYSGTCTYNETTLQGTKFKQRVNILINTDMDDVIEYLYKIGEVTGPQDLERISYLIQTHSRTQIE